MNVIQKEGESNAAFFMRNVAMAAFSACVAESLTIPMDTAKVRLQLQQVAEGEKPRYSGLFGTAKTIAGEEGAMALFGGLMPGLQRQVLFAGLRVGLYIPVRNIITGPLPEGQYPSLLQKIATAMATGTIAISVANPTDLVKIKMQAQGIGKISGITPQYNGSFDCYRQIFAADGIKGLWRGWGPNVVRNSVINAAELASYDQYKQILIQKKILSDGIPCHLSCACAAGFTACIFGSPVDVLKTRIMNAAPGQYAGPLDCVYQTMKEGPAAFYKGFGPNVGRLAAFNCALFLTFEQVKKATA